MDPKKLPPINFKFIHECDLREHRSFHDTIALEHILYHKVPQNDLVTGPDFKNYNHVFEHDGKLFKFNLPESYGCFDPPEAFVEDPAIPYSSKTSPQLEHWLKLRKLYETLALDVECTKSEFNIVRQALRDCFWEMSVHDQVSCAFYLRYDEWPWDFYKNFKKNPNYYIGKKYTADHKYYHLHYAY
jgi:hypothetical protein